MTKRINLSIDIEDNEILDKSIKEAIFGAAKQISRQEFEKHLQSEIERLVNSKIHEMKTAAYYNSTIARITDLVLQRLDKEITINTDDIDKIIENKVNAYLDKKMGTIAIESFVQKYMDKSIGKALIDRAKM